MVGFIKMEWILLGVGLVIGGAGGFFTGKSVGSSNDSKVVVVEPPPTGVEVGTQLADIDLVQVPCSAEFIKDNGDFLCRELFCRMQQRGIDAQTSGADCAAISNMSNSLTLIELIDKSCNIATESTDAFDKCAKRYYDVVTKAKSGQ